MTRLAARQSGGLRSALASAGAASATNLSGMLQRTTAAVKARPHPAATSAAYSCDWSRSARLPAPLGAAEVKLHCWHEAQPPLLVGSCRWRSCENDLLPLPVSAVAAHPASTLALAHALAAPAALMLHDEPRVDSSAICLMLFEPSTQRAVLTPRSALLRAEAPARARLGQRAVVAAVAGAGGPASARPALPRFFLAARAALAVCAHLPGARALGAGGRGGRGARSRHPAEPHARPQPVEGCWRGLARWGCRAGRAGGSPRQPATFRGPAEGRGGAC